jgi:hypothetical protein
MGMKHTKISKWPTQKTEFFKIANSQYFFQIFYGLVLGSVGLIDAKGINVAQPIWLSSCPTKGVKQAKNAFLDLLSDSLTTI